jgi:hypothetical protein
VQHVSTLDVTGAISASPLEATSMVWPMLS